MDLLLEPNHVATYQIPLKDGSCFTLEGNELKMYQMAYPKIDVEGEVRKMIAWCMSNKSSRKTKRGILKFVNGWLNRAKPNQSDGYLVLRTDQPEQTLVLLSR